MTSDRLTQLRTLLALVEKAEGPDRELDYALFAYFAIPEAPNHWHPTVGNHFTDSIDAAVSLIERLIPEMCWSVSRYQLGHHALVNASLWVVGRMDETEIAVKLVDSTPPLALLSALFRALIAKEGGDAV